MNNEANDNGFRREIKRYRERWADELFSMNELHHKTMIALAGGALGLSIAFLRDVFKIEAVQVPSLLLCAWLCLLLSLATALFLLLAGIKARHLAIKQLDENEGRITNERFGGVYSSMTIWLFYAPFALLAAGVLLIMLFVYLNLG